MPDLPLSLRCTTSGTVYVDGLLIANGWDNSALRGGARGVLVLGTEDAGRAQTHADAAVRYFFGPTVTARPQTGPTLWRLFCAPEAGDELEWRPAPDATHPAVLFTAEGT